MKPALITSRSALAILGLLFVASGALRLGSGVGEALAMETDTPPDPAMAETQTCEALPAALATALTERENAVALAEIQLKDRAAALELSEAAIARQMDELIAAEEALAKTLAIADEAAEQDLARLTTVYETMKPKDAAALFETMAPEFAAGFLGRMQPQAAAAVLSGLSPETAYQISLVLAGRNTEAPTE